MYKNKETHTHIQLCTLLVQSTKFTQLSTHTSTARKSAEVKLKKLGRKL